MNSEQRTVNNWIKFKDIDSRSFSGLLICESPTIVKPKVRTQITEIEGKDGDFVDEVGYSAYDKTVHIALYGDDYDIDAVAKYFTGSGQITFSSEPDKYYNAQILEQIDFERLLRFKTANIKFHIQPFKYLVDEQPIILEINDETQLEVTNRGLENSKPVITLFGESIIEISVNGYAQFQVNIDNEYLAIDSELEECYKDNLQTLKNRSMTGIFPVLQPGTNLITWTGNLTQIEIHPKSRWL